MKAILTITAVSALAIAFSAPALAQQANERTAFTHSGDQCAISKVVMAAVTENQQQHMVATKTKIDLLIENALALSHSVKVAGSPVKLGKGSPDG